MGESDRHAHWQNVYSSKGENEVSWFQESPEPSIKLIEQAGATPRTAIIDIGGGASRLVDALIERGFLSVTVLDLSEAALASARARLGGISSHVKWITADVATWQPSETYDVWHDRAAFHFLTSPDDRAAYVDRLALVLKPGGHAIIATFAPDGPEKCSGLPIMRYDGRLLSNALGVDRFALVETLLHEHQTPWGATQKFQFSIFRRV